MNAPRPERSEIVIRLQQAGDEADVFDVVRRAFGRDAEARLVERLHADGAARLSLVAVCGGTIVGHVLFTRLPIVADEGLVESLALAPLSVRPDAQRRGIGTRLVSAGLLRAAGDGQRSVLVVGDAGYYGRFGFRAELVRRLDCPFAGEHFLGRELVAGALVNLRGRVEYPAAFFDPRFAAPPERSPQPPGPAGWAGA
jgi:putative acetyltransferase